MESLIECVPNFSEGRDLTRVDAICSAIAGTPGVLVLNRTSDWDHHRTVITFAGRSEPVIEGSVRAAREAARLIDLRQHRGVHPRVGALDVLPFVPLGSTTLDDCVHVANRAGERIISELGIPIYFYAAAARKPERAQLENVRRGQFEELSEAAITDPNRAPDLGGPALHPSAGAVLVGARKILIAFNINLRTKDLSIARRIARVIRTSSGGLPAVKALGVPLPSRDVVQVSMNLLDFAITPLHVVYAQVEELAAAEGVEIAESEVIGLLPRAAVESAFSHFLKLPGFGVSCTIEEQIRSLHSPTN